jgi:ABC-type Fe3+/spermidine/putrescine transport system ATPase subunit
VSASAAAVELCAVGKRYGTTWAVRGVSLTVAPGEFFTLLGPSGCGKTTALRMIAGFAEPDEGEILLDGRSVAGVPPWRRDLGLVFQSYALWPHLTVFEHVAFGLRERRVPRAELRSRVAEALAMVGLEGMAERRPSQLSGGQQQRVALARTLVVRPRALLLDEPLSNLDAKLRAQMRVELRRLHRELGITTVYVTHDQEEAMALSTRVAVFDHGAVIQLGTPADVYRRPATRFVAEFLGAANLLPATVEPDGDGRRVKLRGGPVMTTDARGVPGTAVLCLIRPETIRLSAGSGTNTFAATVHGAVYLGGRHDCELTLGEGLRLRADLPASAATAPPAPGDMVRVAIAPEDVIVLPA